MNIQRAIILGLLFIGGGSSLSATIPPAALEMVSAGEKRDYEGDWQGPFGEDSHKFRLEVANGSWRGWFVSEKDGSLYPLKDVKVDKGEVHFTFLSDPSLTFHLKLDENKKALSGVATLPDGMALPQTLTRL